MAEDGPAFPQFGENTGPLRSAPDVLLAPRDVNFVDFCHFEERFFAQTRLSIMCDTRNPDEYALWSAIGSRPRTAPRTAPRTPHCVHTVPSRCALVLCPPTPRICARPPPLRTSEGLSKSDCSNCGSVSVQCKSEGNGTGRGYEAR